MSDEAAGLAVQQNKKPKTMEDAYPMAPQSEWPEAWIMKNENNDDDAFDQCQPNRCEPNIPMSAQELQTIGIAYWRMDDVDKYDYPVKAVPYDPKSASDPKLSALRDSRGYSYADIITVHPDHLPEFELKIKAFFEEHIHDAEEIRYILGGSGFFDVRDLQDRWVRIHVKKGDLMTLPEGIYHRFTTDETRMTKAMRLFVGQPIWTPFNRPQEEHESRQKYVEVYQEEKKTEN